MKFSVGDQRKRYETAEDVDEMVAEMEINLHQLVEVDLSGNYFSEEAVERICNVLRGAKSLRIVNLSSAFLGLDRERMHRNLVMLSNMLAEHRIQRIDLSDNAISSGFPEEFGRFVSSASDLVHLKMNNCGLGLVGGNQLGECLKKIENKKVLEIVDIAQNRFFSFPETLSEALLGFENLRELRIQYNTIEEETMLEFLKAFRDHSLEVFDIRDNFLSLDGCRCLGDLFCRWSLRELRIGDCMMGSEGVREFLLRAVAKFTPMALPGDYAQRDAIVLDISYNEFEQDAVEQLAEFCRRNAVRELVVFGNYYEDLDEVVRAVEEQGGAVTMEEHVELSDDISESLVEKVAGL